ncbi:serine hydrolase domain-containing protein [Rhizohabitans arisaemae]|uniref:serine hydrolase domain-containing protein n=1 Tax=Rhizohabitans arisaemae TaxID=2720610 RepID=UPI0024B1C4E9|nr:serine hydrolase domain-containing protein [Rhizohabitans arisaemae]
MDDRDVQTLLDETASRLGVVGAQVAVLVNGEIRAFATGSANVELGRPMTVDTLVQIGSTTKVFTAVLVMSLVEEGKLDLDEPVRTYIPYLRLADAEAEATMTLRHLLSMSSGLDNGPYTTYGREQVATERYIRSVADLPLLFPPGTGYGYSNLATCVAGEAAVQVTGQTWDDLLRERVLEPAGLRQSVTLPEDLVFHRVSVGHGLGDDGEPRVLRPWGCTPTQAAAGETLCTSAADLIRFARIFLDGGAGVLSPESVTIMQSPQVEVPGTLLAESWGVGPYIKNWHGTRLYGHTGTNEGGSSQLLWLPGPGAAFATLSNVPEQGYPLAEELAAVLFPELWGVRHAAPPEPSADIPVDADRLAGVYEEYNTRYEVTVADGRVTVSASSGGPVGPTVVSRLLPWAPDRFIAEDTRLTGNRGWGVSFVGPAGAPATHLVNGFFCARRVR